MGSEMCIRDRSSHLSCRFFVERGIGIARAMLARRLVSAVGRRASVVIMCRSECGGHEGCEPSFVDVAAVSVPDPIDTFIAGLYGEALDRAADPAGATAWSSPADLTRHPRISAWIGLCLAAVTLTGCGLFYWSKPGSTAAEFNRDSSECAREAASNQAAVQSSDIFRQVYFTCLTSRGYVRTQTRDPGPGDYRGLE